MPNRLSIAGLVTAVLALGAPVAAFAQQSVADFYSGKRITVIVGSETGGGYDTNARVLSRHLGKYIPGNPQIIVQNMPGAGSIVATNYLCNVAPKDGTFIGLVQRGMLMAKLTQQAGVQFDPEKINWLGNMSSESSLVVAWHTAPQKKTQDLFTTEMVVGGAGATADTESTPRLLNATIGTKFKIIPGYKGSTSLLLSVENGELQGIADWAWPNIKSRRPDFLREKKITLLLQNGLEKEADLPDVPLALDYAKTPDDRKVLELYFAQKNVARPVMAPPGVPADRIAAMRAAFEKMAVDPEFLDDAKKSGLDVEPMNGAAVDKIMQLIASTPANIGKKLADAITPPK